MFTLKIIYRRDLGDFYAAVVGEREPIQPEVTEQYFYLGDAFSIEYPDMRSGGTNQPILQVLTGAPSANRYDVYVQDEAYIINDRGQTVKTLNRGNR